MYKIIILLILLSLSIVSAQSYVETAKLQSEFALKENREEFRRETLNSIKYAYLVKAKKLEDEKLQDSFQNAVLVYFKSDSLKEAITLNLTYIQRLKLLIHFIPMNFKRK
jgi:hypothetical protein